MHAYKSGQEKEKTNNNTLSSSFLWIVSESLQNLFRIIAQIGVL